MSLVPVRRIWGMQRFCIGRKRLDNLLLISYTVRYYNTERYYREFLWFLMAWETIFLFLGKYLHKPSISTECGGNSTNCKVQAFPVEHFLVFSCSLQIEFKSCVPVKLIQCIQVPKEETLSAPACCCCLLDLVLTDTAGITEWSFEIPSKAKQNSCVFWWIALQRL